MGKLFRNTTIASALALTLGAASSATLVNTWDYQVNTQWIAPTTFTGGTGTTQVNASEISWGATGGSLTVGSGDRSGVLIEDGSEAGSITTNGFMPQFTSSFAHINNVLAAGTSTLLTATVETSLTLTPTSPVAGPALPSQVVNFSIEFAETTNDGSCVEGATSNCDDVFVITFGSLNQMFVYDGITYYASIVKTDGPLDPLSPSACAAAGADPGCLGFLTREGERTAVDFGLLITAEPLVVSEPGALGLAGLALMGMAWRSRRKA